jgi:hypothetical protein
MWHRCIYQLLELDLSLHLIIEYTLRDIYQLYHVIVLPITFIWAFFYLDNSVIAFYFCLIEILPKMLIWFLCFTFSHDYENFFLEDLGVHCQYIIDTEVLFIILAIQNIGDWLKFWGVGLKCQIVIVRLSTLSLDTESSWWIAIFGLQLLRWFVDSENFGFENLVNFVFDLNIFIKAHNFKYFLSVFEKDLEIERWPGLVEALHELQVQILDLVVLKKDGGCFNVFHDQEKFFWDAFVLN